MKEDPITAHAAGAAESCSSTGRVRIGRVGRQLHDGKMAQVGECAASPNAGDTQVLPVGNLRGQHLVHNPCKICEARVGDDHGIPTTLILLSDTEEPTAVILAHLKSEELPLHLQFTTLQNLILGILAIGLCVR